MKKLALFGGISILISSCGGWTETDKKNFLDDCEKSKFSTEYCNCALTKMTTNYSTYKEMVEDEENSAKLMVDCIPEDRIEKE